MTRRASVPVSTTCVKLCREGEQGPLPKRRSAGRGGAHSSNIFTQEPVTSILLHACTNWGSAQKRLLPHRVKISSRCERNPLFGRSGEEKEGLKDRDLPTPRKSRPHPPSVRPFVSIRELIKGDKNSDIERGGEKASLTLNATAELYILISEDDA